MNLKELIIAVLVVVSGVLNAYLWKQLIFSGSYSDLALFSLPIASLFLFVVSFAMLAMLGENVLLGLFAVIAAFIGSFFFVKASTAVLSGLLLTLVIALWAFRGIRKEAKSQNIPQMNRVLRQGLPLFFTAVAVMISVFYFSGIAISEPQTFVPKAAFELTIPYLEGVLQNILPGFKASLSVNELLRKNAEEQLEGELGLKSVPEEQLKKLVEEQRRALEQGLGLKISGEERAGDLIYSLANQKAEDFLGPYKRYIPYLSAFGFFLAIKVLTFPLYLISLALVWLTVKLLLAFEFIKRETVSVEVEKLSL